MRGTAVSVLKRNRLGIEYSPVTWDDILRLIDRRGPIWSAGIGVELWVHLHGMGPSRGGPSSCEVAANFQLGRLEKRKLVRKRGDNHWVLTSAGRKRISRNTPRVPEVKSRQGIGAKR